MHSYDSSKVLVSGGTDLYVQIGEELSNKDFSLLSEIICDEKIKVIDDECIISSSATVEDLESSTIINNIFHDFNQFAEQFGSVQIRNKATVGGNINNASPIGDMTIFFLALNAKIFLLGKGVHREILLKDYFKGYKLLDRNSDEIMTKISFKIPKNNFRFSFEKICRRFYLDIASVNTAFYSEVTDRKFTELHISAGGVAPIPLYLTKTGEYLKGKEVSADNLQYALKICLEEISPITDSRGSAEYKRLLLRNLLQVHFIKLFPEVIKEEVIL
jgi:xanthine dehydrogenase small subunit